MAEQSPLGAILAHLKDLQQSPEQKGLNQSLVEQARIQLREPTLPPSRVIELANLILPLLRTSQDDLEGLVRLLSEAVELVTFDQLQTSIPVEVVIEGLRSSSASVQSLSLSYLEKAAESPSGAAFVANDDTLVSALIVLFLTSKSAEIGGTRALNAIVSLLDIDNPEKVATVASDGQYGEARGQGLLWRRIFHDKKIFGLFFHYTTPKNSSHGLSISDVTTAQARLLELVLGVAKMHWDVVENPSKFNIEMSGTEDSTRQNSLLRYVALEMVDGTDYLMMNVLIDFQTRLLGIKNPAGCAKIASIPSISSPSLEFLEASGLQKQATDYYLRSEDFDPLRTQLLGGAEIRYLCAYADFYPEHFLQNADLEQKVLRRLDRNLHIRTARWAHGPSPVKDLNVLAHIPAVALLRVPTPGENPLVLLPTNPANSDAFETLGKVFHGPGLRDSEAEAVLKARWDLIGRDSQAAVARVLFYQYHNNHPEFWSNVGAAMNVLAMPQAAFSALGLVKNILTAVWVQMPKEHPGTSATFLLPTEEQLKELCSGNVYATGMAEVLTAGQSVITSLLTPLTTMGGDTEAARLAWRLEREKFDMVILMDGMMNEGVGKAEVPSQSWHRIRERIQERIRLDRRSGFTTQPSLVGTMGV